jgi:hypothetical protein
LKNNMRRKKLEKKNNKVVVRGVQKYILFAVAGVLAISSVFMTVETATSGVEVSSLRQKESELSMEKRNLESSLVRTLSMNDLELKGTEMGYAKPVTMVYVSESQEAMARLP